MLMNMCAFDAASGFQNDAEKGYVCYDKNTSILKEKPSQLCKYVPVVIQYKKRPLNLIDLKLFLFSVIACHLH